ncbi:hypothetical protein IWQ60_004533 [Tieghemiomyces parasiticus]|uniref:Uncharacterized protein n=1 Tax=Tieghemiomyces parasiticus TaxID=78921 RepID=A0A9W8DZP5_9FUNG|nr:hypothetical protein IWQ60_004533 [Tieghemiomyces parasiticus]
MALVTTASQPVPSPTAAWSTEEPRLRSFNVAPTPGSHANMSLSTGKWDAGRSTSVGQVSKTTALEPKAARPTSPLKPTETTLATLPPAPLPAPAPTPAVESPTKRTRILQEILTTERTYVEGLLLVDRLLYTPLHRASRSGGTAAPTSGGPPPPTLSTKRVADIFANFSDILNVNREFLAQLEARFRPDPTHSALLDTDLCIGDVFLSVAPFFKMYSVYIRNFHRALTLLRTTVETSAGFRAFIRTVNAHPELKSLTIDSYLMLPIQRLPRYRLLLADLTRHTPDSHPDHPLVTRALQVIEEVAQFVNDMIRQHEMYTAMVAIQKCLHGFQDNLLVPGRRLIKRGPVRKICRKNHQPREFFLFTDVLIYASPALLENTFNFHRKFPLEECRVIDVPDTPKAALKNVFQIYSREKSFGVYTETARAKQEWVKVLHRAIADHITARKTLRIDHNSSARRAQSMYITTQCHVASGACATTADHASTPGSPLSVSHLTMSPSSEISDTATLTGIDAAVAPPALHLTPAPSAPAASPTSPRVVENYNAPVWVPDEQAVRCLICYEEFNLFRRKHHCRACGHVVCHYCSTKTIVIPGSWEAEDKEARACDQCVALLFGKEHLNDSKQQQHQLQRRSSTASASSSNPGSARNSLFGSSVAYFGRTRASRSSSSATAAPSLFGLVANPFMASTPDLTSSSSARSSIAAGALHSLVRCESHNADNDRRRWSSSATPGTPQRHPHRISIGHPSSAAGPLPLPPSSALSTASNSSSVVSSPTSPKVLVDYGLSAATTRRMSFMSWTYGLPRSALSSVSLTSSQEDSVFSVEAASVASARLPDDGRPSTRPSSVIMCPSSPLGSVVQSDAARTASPDPRSRSLVPSNPLPLLPVVTTVATSPSRGGLPPLASSTSEPSTGTVSTAVSSLAGSRPTRAKPPSLPLSPSRRAHRVYSSHRASTSAIVLSDISSPFYVAPLSPKAPPSTCQQDYFVSASSLASSSPLMPAAPPVGRRTSRSATVVVHSHTDLDHGTKAEARPVFPSAQLRDQMRHSSARKPASRSSFSVTGSSSGSTDGGLVSDVAMATRCHLCRQDFTVFRWRNTCSRCHAAVCADCLTKRSSPCVTVSATTVGVDSGTERTSPEPALDSPSPLAKQLPDGAPDESSARQHQMATIEPAQLTAAAQLTDLTQYLPSPSLPSVTSTLAAAKAMPAKQMPISPPPSQLLLLPSPTDSTASDPGLSLLSPVNQFFKCDTLATMSTPMVNRVRPPLESRPPTVRYSCPPDNAPGVAHGMLDQTPRPPTYTAAASRRNLTVGHSALPTPTQPTSLCRPPRANLGSGSRRFSGALLSTPANAGKLCDACVLGLDPRHIQVNPEGNGWFYKLAT